MPVGRFRPAAGAAARFSAISTRPSNSPAAGEGSGAAPLDPADGGEFLVQLPLVARAEPRFQAVRVFQDVVQDALAITQAAGQALARLLRVAAAEEALE